MKRESLDFKGGSAVHCGVLVMSLPQVPHIPSGTLIKFQFITPRLIPKDEHISPVDKTTSIVLENQLIAS